MRQAKSVIITLVILFLTLQPNQQAMSFANLEKKLIFYPINKNMSEIRLNPETSFQDTYFYSSDGIKLNGWYIKAKENMPTVVYCHGQGENISLWQDVAQVLTDRGYGVFMLDYRGHGRSKGTPSETGLYRDLESAINYLKKYEDVKQKDMILWGRSLGGAVVADVASRDEFKAVILESTFTNIRDAAIHLTDYGILEGKYGFWEKVCMKFVKTWPFRQTFETDRKIGKITEPLFIAHSIHDETIPVKMSYKLARLNPRAKLFISDKGSHHSSEWVFEDALGFLNTID